MPNEVEALLIYSIRMIEIISLVLAPLLVVHPFDAYYAKYGVVLLVMKSCDLKSGFYFFNYLDVFIIRNYYHISLDGDRRYH